MDIQSHQVTRYMYSIIIFKSVHKNQILVLVAYASNEGSDLGFQWKLKRFAPAVSTMYALHSTYGFHGDMQTQRCSCKQNWCFP